MSTKTRQNNKKQNLRLDYVDTARLKPYERNAKVHSKKQIAKIIQSMKTFGVVTPILVNKNYEVIAGHGRLEALKELGYQTVPVIMLEHLSEDQVKAYRLADNKIAQEATYDEDILKIELQELILSNEVVITDTGFDIADVDEIVIDGYGEKKEKPDKVDEIDDINKIKQQVNEGDIWKLGKHLLICANALNIESYQELLNSDKADLVITDAPYNVKIQGHVCGKGKTKHKEFAMASGEMSDNEFEAFVSVFMSGLVQFSKNGSLQYLFIDWRGLRIFLNAGAKFYTDLKNICIWNKMNGGMGSLYRSQYEAICVFKNGTLPHKNNVELGKNGRYRTNVWNHRGVSATNPKSLELLKLHPTVKPVGLLHEILLDATAPNDIVLDCFGGSGSTLLACEQANRQARLIEIDPQYCDVTIYRWEKLTGKKAKFIRNITNNNTFTNSKENVDNKKGAENV